MIFAIAAHLCIGLGGLACGVCGRRLCRHNRVALVALTGIFLVAEATASVVVIDRLFQH
jgi:hypothetical protein